MQLKALDRLLDGYIKVDEHGKTVVKPLSTEQVWTARESSLASKHAFIQLQSLHFVQRERELYAWTRGHEFSELQLLAPVSSPCSWSTTSLKLMWCSSSSR